MVYGPVRIAKMGYIPKLGWPILVNWASDYYYDMTGSCPAKMSCTQSVWEAWWLKYMTANVLSTLYAAHQEGYAVDHREVGYHHKEKGVALFRSVVPRWEQERELENLPDTPDMIGERVRLTVSLYEGSCSDLFLRATNKLGGYHFKKIKSRAAVAVVRLVESEEDRAELVGRLEVMSEMEREVTAVIITREVQK